MSERIFAGVAAVLVAVVLAAPLEAATPERPALEELAQVPISTEGSSPATLESAAAGSDLAFQEDLLVAGAYEGIGLFRILERRPYLKQISFFECPGAQADVSVWGDYVFVSTEHQSSYSATPNTGVSETCNPAGGGAGVGMEGIRIIDISDPRSPRQVKFVPIVCGSHTHTLIPDGKKLYLYNSALPLYFVGDYAPYCNRVTILEMPIDDPTQASVVAEPSMDLEAGCHDITAFPDKGLALGACWTNSWLWDIRDPAEPKVISKLPTDWAEGHHAAAFTWDGKYVAVGQEAGNCKTDEGEIAFYDIRNRKNPKKVGRFHLPRAVTGSFCWAHNFGAVPTKDRSRYVLTAGFYNGGTTVVDFSDPRRPREVAFAAEARNGVRPQPWGAYWYNGRIYSNDWMSRFGVTVYEMDGLGAADGFRYRQRLNPQLQLRDW